MQDEQQFYINSLSDYMDWVDDLRPYKCLFRGLPNKDHSIEASAWRRLANEQDSNNIDKLLEINEGLIKDARDRGFGIKDERNLYDLEILAELQHFRASTFLIDFTYSAQVALWFACQQRFKDPQNSKEFADGKVCVVIFNPDKIKNVTQDLLERDCSVFFETDATGKYSLYWWEPGEFNSRISPQHSVFLFGGDRTIEPDGECIISAEVKRAIHDSIEGFSQTTETTLFPDFDGFVQQRTQDRPYILEDYERIRAAGYRAYQGGNYENAISFFNEVLHQNPSEADVYYWRGNSKLHLELFEEAIDDLNRAIELNDNATYYSWRGFAKHCLNQNHKAEEDLEKALELANSNSDRDEELVNSIYQLLLEVSNRIKEVDLWTPEMFKELVPVDIREHYDIRVGDEDLYSLGADLESLIREKEWRLNRRFGRSYFVFCYGRRRVFGVNLFRNPRLAIWGTGADESKFSNLDHKPVYYDVHQQWVFPREIKVEDISDVLDSVYDDVQNEKQTDGPRAEQVSLFGWNEKLFET